MSFYPNLSLYIRMVICSISKAEWTWVHSFVRFMTDSVMRHLCPFFLHDKKVTFKFNVITSYRKHFVLQDMHSRQRSISTGIPNIFPFSLHSSSIQEKIFFSTAPSPINWLATVVQLQPLTLSTFMYASLYKFKYLCHHSRHKSTFMYQIHSE